MEFQPIFVGVADVAREKEREGDNRPGATRGSFHKILSSIYVIYLERSPSSDCRKREKYRLHTQLNLELQFRLLICSGREQE
jgi:hypothetical protein